MKTTEKQIDLSEIYREQDIYLQLVGATNEFGRPMRTYDDYGPLWYYEDADCLTAIISAQSWEDAYSILEDEFLPRVPMEDMHEAYGIDLLSPCPEFSSARTTWDVCDDVENTRTSFQSETLAKAYINEIMQSDRDLVEGYGYQSNSTGSGIIKYCQYGERLVPVTQALLSEHGITLQVTQD